MTTDDVLVLLGRLQAERLEARESGLGGNALYMAELEQDLTETREAYTVLAVTEIATFRAQLTSPQWG